MDVPDNQDIRQFLSFRRVKLSCSQALLEMSSEYHHLLFHHLRIKGQKRKAMGVFNPKFSESLIPQLKS